jgi:hypothetical protein
MDEFDEWPISNEELEKQYRKQEKDKKLYNHTTCETRKKSDENCLYCRLKCTLKP